MQDSSPVMPAGRGKEADRQRLKLASRTADANPMQTGPTLASERGFTLIEVMASILLLTIGIMATVSLIDQANVTTASNKAREGGTALTREIAENARALPYSTLDNVTALENALRARAGLEDDSGASGWQIQRRGFTYTITLSVCTFDDAKDQLGPHVGAGFCAGAAGTVDTVPDDYKRVTVTASWVRGSQTQTSRQTTLVNNPGNSFGPAITSLDLAGGLLIHDSSILGFNFDVLTSRVAARVEWSLDGVPQADAVIDPANPDGRHWEFTWTHLDDPSLPGNNSLVVDGTYLVGAQAFNSDGLSGGTKAIQVVLDRYPPLPPVNLVAGRAGSDTDPPGPTDRIVDIEWRPNLEKDIIGYEVYQVVGAMDGTIGAGDDTLVCETVGANSNACVDETPAVVGGVYYVVSLDNDTATAGSPARRSAPSPVTFSDLTPRPGPVVGLCKTEGAAGSDVTLSWDEPAAGTADFYRVYRKDAGGAPRVPDDRYRRVGTPANPGDPVTMTDAGAAGAGHRYFVAAVNDDLNESSTILEATATCP